MHATHSPFSRTAQYRNAIFPFAIPVAPWPMVQPPNPMPPIALLEVQVSPNLKKLPAGTLATAAVASSAVAAKKPPHAVEVRWAIADGAVVLLSGRDLAIALPQENGKSASVAQRSLAWLTNNKAAFGLEATGDGWALDRVVPIGAKGWVAVHVARYRYGLPVLGQAAVVVIDSAGLIRHFSSTAMPIPGGSAAPSAVSVAGGSAWWLPDNMSALPILCNVGVVAMPKGGAEVQVTKASTGQVLSRTPESTSATFDVVVTTRDVQNVSNLHQCVTSAPAPVACADVGVTDWRFGNPVTQQCCVQQCPTCDPWCAGACVPPKPPEVVAGSAAAGQVFSAMQSIGITSIDAIGDPVVVVAPYQSGLSPPCKDGPPPQNACGAAGLQPTCGANSIVAAGQCAKALFPGATNSAACTGALGNATAAILLSDAANQQPDVLGHEFGHLWLRGHAVPHGTGNSLLAQPAAIHEAISDGLGLVADADDWLLAESTVCESYRSACRPWCPQPAGPGGTTDAACTPPAAPAPTPGTCLVRPWRWSDYTLKPPGALGYAEHHNAGILDFAWYLAGEPAQKQVGDQVIVGWGKPALGAALAAIPGVLPTLLSQPLGAPMTPTFMMLREAFAVAAESVQAGFGQIADQAMDGVGIWRFEARSGLFGVGRVATFEQSAGGGPALLFAVNWDGLRRNELARCDGLGTCTFGAPVRLEDQTWPPEGYPTAPPAVVPGNVNEHWLMYPGAAGNLIAQQVQAGVVAAPFVAGNTDINGVPTSWPTGLLRPNLAVGAAASLGWGPGAGVPDVVVAYLCKAPWCSCNGQQAAPDSGILCVSDVLRDVQIPLATVQLQWDPATGAISPRHEPAIVAIDGRAVVAWLDHPAGAAKDRVWVSSSATPLVAASWTPPSLWLTAGEMQQRDFPVHMTRPFALAVLPPATGQPIHPDDLRSRLYLQYQFVSDIPPLPDSGGDSGRVFAIATSAVSAGGALEDLSMGVGQNHRLNTLLGHWVTPVVPAGTNSAHGPAGAFGSALGQSWFLVRGPSTSGEPLMPDYGLSPVEDYGPITVFRVGWR